MELADQWRCRRYCACGLLVGGVLLRRARNLSRLARRALTWRREKPQRRGAAPAIMGGDYLGGEGRCSAQARQTRGRMAAAADVVRSEATAWTLAAAAVGRNGRKTAMGGCGWATDGMTRRLSPLAGDVPCAGRRRLWFIPRLLVATASLMLLWRASFCRYAHKFFVLPLP